MAAFEVVGPRTVQGQGLLGSKISASLNQPSLIIAPDRAKCDPIIIDSSSMGYLRHRWRTDKLGLQPVQINLLFNGRDAGILLTNMARLGRRLDLSLGNVSGNGDFIDPLTHPRHPHPFDQDGCAAEGAETYHRLRRGYSQVWK